MDQNKIHGKYVMNLIIRRARAEDSDAIWEVRSHAIKAIDSVFYSKAEIEAWYNNEKPQHFEKVITNLDWFVAVINGKIVGSGFLDVLTSEVGAIFIEPEFQRLGIGKRLLIEIERQAKERDLETLYLEVTLSSVPFYEAAGYQSIEQSECQLDTIKLTSQKMSKIIK